MAWKTKTQTGTPHAVDCARVFSRYDLNCPRCIELSSGSKPRAGWGDAKKRDDAIHLQAIKDHNCTASNCGPVCTFGDW